MRRLAALVNGLDQAVALIGFYLAYFPARFVAGLRQGWQSGVTPTQTLQTQES